MMEYISIDRTKTVTLSKQICDAIKQSIWNNRIQDEEKLPSSRELAKQLNVSRNVVIESYEQLIAEDYAYSKKGAGTYIHKVQLSYRDKNRKIKQEPMKKQELKEVVCFRTGIPDLSQIPIKRWGQLYHKIALDVPQEALDYQSPCGSYELRMQISQYLNRVRGADTKPEQILITNGAAQAFHLLCQLVSEKEYVLVENPLSYGLYETIRSNGVTIKTIEVDEHGLRTELLPKKAPKLIFTTPGHQFPTGTILSLQRRMELIQYANQTNAYLVEDDYDSDFRFDGDPIQPMQYRISGEQIGLHMLAEFPMVDFDENLRAFMKEIGIEVALEDRYDVGAKKVKQFSYTLVLGYGNVEVENVRPVLLKLRDYIQERKVPSQ